MPLQAWVHEAVALTELLLEAAAATIFLVAGVRAFALWAWGVLGGPRSTEKVRSRFAHSLLLGLDFTIGADVLAVAAAPSMDRVLVIALVVAVRIALTLVLEYELKRDQRKEEKEKTSARGGAA